MFVLSSDTFAAEHTGAVLWHVLSGLSPRVRYEQYALLHVLIRKAAHLTEYAILACLLHRALRAGAAEAWHWRWATCALVLVAICAGLDEYHQAYTQSRTGSVADSVLDMAGGLVALTLLGLRQRIGAGRGRRGVGPGGHDGKRQAANQAAPSRRPRGHKRRWTNRLSRG
jgi:VanZ family protein